ncbi:MAG: hypothetical protein AVDCRST_MAG34-2042, partial [uncultured Nocardioidaceae bacterium]
STRPRPPPSTRRPPPTCPGCCD